MNCEYEIIDEMTEVIGKENTMKLIERFSGEQIYIPVVKRVSIKDRNARIISDYKKGFSYTQLKNRYRLTERQIRNIITKHKENQ